MTYVSIRALVILLSLLVSIWPACAIDIPTNAEKLIVRITESGFDPATVTLNKSDSTVFFFNASKKNLDTFAIDFGKNRLHCHNPSLVLNQEGILTSTQPIIPGSFVIACFPDVARYPVRASIGNQVVNGTVAVPDSAER